MTTWQRIEGLCRSEALSGGLEARIADPLWMLARQWQVGELRGDDAARPIGVRLRTRSLRLATLTKGTEHHSAALPRSVPLEYLAEQIAEPTEGEAGLYSAARLGHRLLRLLARAGLQGARDALLTEFALATPRTTLAPPGLMAETAAMLSRRALDGRKVLLAEDSRLRAVLASTLDGEQTTAALGIIGSWRARCDATGAQLATDGWDNERLEYSFTVTAGSGADTLAFSAAEHTGGDVDWFSFDVAAPIPAKGAPKLAPPKSLPPPLPLPPPPLPPLPRERPAGELRTLKCLPSPVRFRGQPTQRWWGFEDGATNFADIEAGPADLARLIVTEFAVGFSDDWFMVPARVPVGSVTEVLQMTVVDNFGGEIDVPSTAAHDDAPQGARPWRMFELTGDELVGKHVSPWILVPTTVVGGLTGAPLERVSLVRDEGANLVWGIEKLVEGPAGRSLDRATLAAPGPASTGAEPMSYDEQVWAYHLESRVPPPFWIPFLPERISPGSAQVRLRRARMEQWQSSDAAAPGAHGVVLDPRRPCWIREEEVPRSGIRVDRRWRYARGDDGVGHLWLQLEKAPGSGERSSGVRWDVIDIASS